MSEAAALNPPYKPNRALRRALQALARGVFRIITDLEIAGQENFPASGPLIMVGNHFSFIDPMAFVSLAPWPMDFIGGAVTPHAPKIVRFIPRLWGFLPVYRGTGSTYALKEAEKILKGGGVVGIFPEGGSWAQTLRPARPGAALLTSRANAPLLPIGLINLPRVIPSLKKLKTRQNTLSHRQAVWALYNFRQLYERRKQLDEIGNEIMKKIAELIPPEQGGVFSSNPEIRAAAVGKDYYPWEGIREDDREMDYPKE